MKDTLYYDQESGLYSKKRYPDLETTYTQFLFKRRLGILLEYLRTAFDGKPSVELLEVGCADGYVLSQVNGLALRAKRLLGVDISPGMVEVAKRRSTDKMRFCVRESYDFSREAFDGIIEIGVLNLTDFVSDVAFAKEHLKTDGYYICSIAASTALVAKLKPGNKEDYCHFLTYPEYEAELRKHFSVIRSVPYGLFIPYLWRSPRLARIIQPAVENLFKKLVPRLFHEKIYLLKKG